MVDHVHILFLLNPNHALKVVLKNVKVESSPWINPRDVLRTKFAWQVGYGAFSVSESSVPIVQQYIEKQEEHHRRRTFLEEYEEFMEKHGLTFIAGSLSDSAANGA
jgi:putative transposase